jgi:hypothetical protein
MTLTLTEDIIAYENGELDEDQTISLFQRLLDSRMIYVLQGCYGRECQRLLDEGLIQ